MDKSKNLINKNISIDDKTKKKEKRKERKTFSALKPKYEAEAPNILPEQPQFKPASPPPFP